MSRADSVRPMIEIMQAWADGKIIQCKENNGWHKGWVDVDTPRWNWSECEYRVKLEPKVVWINEYVGGDGNRFYGAGFFSSKEDAKKSGLNRNSRQIKFVEVMESIHDDNS